MKITIAFKMQLSGHMKVIIKKNSEINKLLYFIINKASVRVYSLNPVHCYICKHNIAAQLILPWIYVILWFLF